MVTRGYRIYRNLHSQTWTVQEWIVGKGWRKCGGYEKLRTGRADFTVGVTGRDRVRREGRKNVHAFAVVPWYDGLGQQFMQPCSDDWKITYNPYNDDGFRAERSNDPHIDCPNIEAGFAPIFNDDGYIYCTAIRTSTGERK